MSEVKWEPIRPWPESIVSLRYVAFTHDGMIVTWPSSRWRRLWLRYRPWRRWFFVEDSMLEAQRKKNVTFGQIVSAPHYSIPVRHLSLNEIKRRYTDG